MSVFSELIALLALFDAPPPPGTPQVYPAAEIAPADDDAPTAPPDHAPTLRRPRPLMRLHPRILIGYASVFGAAMILVAFTWHVLLRGHSPADWFPADGWLRDIAIGLAVGSLFTALEVLAETLIPSLKRLERMFLTMIDMRALRWHHALMLGLLAGVPEEILFRGTLQPELGLLPAALVFGALHAATPTYFVYATVAGLVLGALAQWSGGLWSAITAHATIDVIMFLLLMRTWQRDQSANSAPPRGE